MIKILITILLVSTQILVLAQEEKESSKKNKIRAKFSVTPNVNKCASDMAEAELLYKSGEFLNSLNLLNSILKNCKRSDLGEQIFELQIRNNLSLSRDFEADTLFRKLLSIYPDYRPTTTGLEENYLRLFNHYTVLPKWSIGMSFERIIPAFQTIGKINKINDKYDYSSVYKNDGISFGIGNSLTYSTASKFRFSLFYTYRTMKLNRDVVHSTYPEYLTQYTEKNQQLNTGLELGHYHVFRKLNFFYGVGMSASFLFRAEGVFQASLPDYNVNTAGSDFLIPDIGFDLRLERDMKEFRRTLNFAPKIFIGFDYNFNKSWSASFSYVFEAPIYPFNSTNLFTDEEIMFKTYYVENNSYYRNHLLKMSVALNFSNHVKNKFPLYAK
jgi:tetratricopeptide (TPR) repeat protein